MHKKTKGAIALAGLSAIALALSATQPKETTPITQTPTTPAHPSLIEPTPSLPQTTLPSSRFGTFTKIEPDLDTIWTYENSPDGQYLIDLHLRYKQTGFRTHSLPVPSDPTRPTAQFPRGQLLTLRRDGTNRAYQIIGNNGNYFGTLHEKLEGTVRFTLSEDTQPFPTLLRTFVFEPRQERKVY
ncbi:hypothetical protein C4580_04890 [Candidatus Woesearchaeota archaeon]|nr:MAG: hypothetical protein C4580_04890 [Candidatus Woesearchaeota archaeon]